MACLALSACDEFNDFTPSCSDSGQGTDVDGSWDFRAEGTREDCPTEELNGALEIVNLSEVRVRACLVAGGALEFGEAPPGENDAFVARIQNHDFSLIADEGYPSDETEFASVTGGFVDGSCVKFTLSDPRSDGLVRYDFEGNIENDGIHGIFTGNGPELGCRTRGTFDVRITASAGLPICPAVTLPDPETPEEDASVPVSTPSMPDPDMTPVGTPPDASVPDASTAEPSDAGPADASD